MRLERSQIGMRSVPGGIALQAPVAEQHRATLESVGQRHSVVRTEAHWLLEVAQREREGSLIDTEDRVQTAASLLRDLIAAGL